MTQLDGWKSDRIGAALSGRNPTVLRRMSAGFAVIGDVQLLPGYCVLLADDPRVGRLTDLPRERRLRFLADLDRLGEAVQNVCTRRDPRFQWVDLEVQGSGGGFLHAHVWPRYDREGVARPERVLGPQHDDLRAQLVQELAQLSAAEQAEYPTRHVYGRRPLPR
jgi:diadenosine tetraphosphate (Ap4A) HIT family hydrolase